MKGSGRGGPVSKQQRALRKAAAVRNFRSERRIIENRTALQRESSLIRRLGVKEPEQIASRQAQLAKREAQLAKQTSGVSGLVNAFEKRVAGRFGGGRSKKTKKKSSKTKSKTKKIRK